jgi:hypothetical protein
LAAACDASAAEEEEPAVQTKLAVNEPGDSFEQEADTVAEQVMRATPRLQRASLTAVLPEEEEQMQTKREGSDSGVSEAPPLVHHVLREPGEPLDIETRRFMEPRFGQELGHVRVHAGPRAADSARAVHALAYTVGNNIVFGAGQHAPGGDKGKRLIAHELAHVIQQTGGSRPHSATRIPVVGRPSAPMLSRQNTVQTSSVLGRGLVAGVQIIVDGTMNSTRVGPVSGREDVSVIAGRLTTFRSLAEVLLPLWNSATPFTPSGSTTPVPFTALTVDELAKGLLVYNRYRLAIPPAATSPAMTNWKIGMRIRLPIGIDAATNEGILHPDPIRSMAGTFDPTWTSLLDQLPAVLPSLPAADLTQSVTDFFTNEPSITGRGIHLGARAVANAQDNREFILEAFNQAGSGAFELALAFMDFLVNRDISILAAQEAGAAILSRIQALLGAPPATITPGQQTSLTRATGMLGRVAGVQAHPLICVPNRQVTWDNFTGTPAASGFEALTAFRVDQVPFQGNQLFQATMNQASSWVRPRSAQPGNIAVNGCQPLVDQCTQFFNANPGGGTWSINGNPSTTCPAAVVPAAGSASNVGQCASVIGAACTAARVADSNTRLLRHEQLHFDLACVLAHRANAARAAGRTVTLAGVRTRVNTLTGQYDTQTNHGCNAGPQARWDADITAGLTGQNFP